MLGARCSVEVNTQELGRVLAAAGRGGPRAAYCPPLRLVSPPATLLARARLAASSRSPGVWGKRWTLGRAGAARAQPRLFLLLLLLREAVRGEGGPGPLPGAWSRPGSSRSRPLVVRGRGPRWRGVLAVGHPSPRPPRLTPPPPPPPRGVRCAASGAGPSLSPGFRGKLQGAAAAPGPAAAATARGPAPAAPEQAPTFRPGPQRVTCPPYSRTLRNSDWKLKECAPSSGSTLSW